MTSTTDTIALTGSAATGIEGLDDVLAGGFTRNRIYLLEGDPGTGKTTTAMRFLMEGAKNGERGLYITLSETIEELEEAAASHGLSWDGIDLFELVPPESLLDEQQQQSLLYSSDLELGETTRLIFEAVEKFRPNRLVIDSLSEIRLLAQSSLRYRRQILALKHYFAKINITVLMLDDNTAERDDLTVHSIAHGVIRLEESAPDYGAERRRMRVVKYRGRKFRGGYHDFNIVTGGVQVYPRLVSQEHVSDFTRGELTSGSEQLDALLGGGVERGSSVLVLGPAGAGKSLLTLTFVVDAMKRGEKACIMVFDEEMGLLFRRTKALGFDLQSFIDKGNLFIEQIDAAEQSPGEFAHRVRYLVEDHGVQTVVVDSLNGYQAAMPQEKYLVLHMHELTQFLNRKGCTTFLTIAQHGLVGDMKAPVDVTYLADTVILLRFFEAAGQVRRAIAVIKKRAGPHEKTIREYRIDHRGFIVGDVLKGFQGVLRGVPDFIGGAETLMQASTE